MPNRLINETSPYLLQHADNPVDWYPWGEEALTASREQNKPILLSIGYSACHWCHVMAHESFENDEIAQVMNEHFINIKVDREERPDLDSVYMTAVQLLTGHGGWPMTVFLTPQGEPFYGGTYYPPTDRPVAQGQIMPGFPRILLAVSEAYRNRHDEIRNAANEIRTHLNQHYANRRPEAALGTDVLDEAARNITVEYDRTNGGFGTAPKFPPSMTLEFLLRTWRRTGADRALEMTQFTLDRMARGGIYDQVGGGFHRYAVDEIWLVPHFEKMLYDNAQLSRIYTLGWQATGNDFYRHIANETFDYVLREMTSPEGAFYSTQDADTEGEEGKFYVWTVEEIEQVLGAEQARIVNAFYAAEPGGNFEGHTVLSVPREPVDVAGELGVTLDELETTIGDARKKLYEARSGRTWPGRDEKVLTTWNGLMLRAIAEAAVTFERTDLLDAATANARFLKSNLYVDGRLLRTWKNGQAKLDAYLEDYANLVDGLISLYEATFDPEWLVWAHQLADTMIVEFWDDEDGGFFDTGTAHETLVARPKETFDSATPSGNSVAAEALQRLSLLRGEEDYRRRALRILEAHGSLAAERPSGFGRMLTAYDFAMASTREIAIVGDRADNGTQNLLRTVRTPYLPWKVIAQREAEVNGEVEAVPLLHGRSTVDGKPTAYVCQNYICQQPVTSAGELAQQLGIAEG